MCVRSQRRETPTKLRRVVNGGARCDVAVRMHMSVRAISEKTRSRKDRKAMNNNTRPLRISQKQHSTRPCEEWPPAEWSDVPADAAGASWTDTDGTPCDAGGSACAAVLMCIVSSAPAAKTATAAMNAARRLRDRITGGELRGERGRLVEQLGVQGNDHPLRGSSERHPLPGRA